MLCIASISFACLLTAVQSKAPEPQTATLSAQDFAAFLDVLAEPDPRKRTQAARQVAKGSKAPLASWESALAKRPRPWLAQRLSAEEREPGLHEKKLALWGGMIYGLLETNVLFYRPQDLAPRELRPLLIVSHGSGGRAAGEMQIWRSLAAREKIFVIAADEQKENKGHAATAHERLTPVALRRWALLHLAVDPAAVFIAGTSRGGHITWDVITRFPDLWAGAIPCIGGPRLDPTRGASNLRLVENLLDLPIRDLQGSKDDPGLIFNLRLAFKILHKARDAKLYLQKGRGHSYDLNAVKWKRFFAKRKAALPAKFIFRSVALDQARCHWLRFTRFDTKLVKDAYRPQVRSATWKRMNNNARKRWVEKDAEKHTARVVARLQGKAGERDLVIEKLRGVRKLEALLPRALWPRRAASEKPLKLFVKLGSKRKALHPKENLALWIEDLAARVDPASAAVARVALPVR